MVKKYQLQVYCHGVEKHRYFFTNLLLISYERGEMLLHIVLCGEINYELIIYFRPFLGQIATKKACPVQFANISSAHENVVKVT